MNARNGLRRHERCKDWISKIEAIQPKVTKLLEDKTAEIERLSMCGYCSTNFFLTYCYGKDVWEKMDLKKIGIPLPSQENGSKVVFTTRSKDVCARMRSHHVLEVKKLDEENAWELFRRNFRGNNTLSDPEILKLARQLCEKCEGLPLALNVIL
ncbi:unnamed protein product [Brassica oleracea var. botrytis]